MRNFNLSIGLAQIQAQGHHWMESLGVLQTPVYILMSPKMIKCLLDEPVK